MPSGWGCFDLLRRMMIMRTAAGRIQAHDKSCDSSIVQSCVCLHPEKGGAGVISSDIAFFYFSPAGPQTLPRTPIYLPSSQSRALICLIPLCSAGGSSSNVSRYFGLWSEIRLSGASSRFSVVSSRTVSATW